MRKVLFISNVVSHIEAFHLPYLEWFKNQGYEVHVLTNTQGKTELAYCDKLFDVQIERSPFNLRNLKAYKEAKRIIDSEEYEIIHSHTPIGGVIGRLASVNARKKGTKIFYTAHGFHFYKGAPLVNWLLYYTMEWLLSKKTDLIITINQEDFFRAQKRFSSKRTTVKKINGIGVNLHKFSPVTLEEKETLKRKLGYDNEFLLIYAAEFISRKNHKLFIDAAKQLLESCPNIKFLFCGKGELMNELQDYAKQKDVEGQIDFLGFRKDMPELYKISDLLISASIEEGFGINIIEGMATGLPAVVSVVRGHREMLNDGENGYMFSPQNVEEFTAIVEKLYLDREHYQKLSTAAKNTAQKFSIENSLSQMEAIYKEYDL